MWQEHQITSADYADNDRLVSQIKAEKIVPYDDGGHKRAARKDLLRAESRKTVVMIVVIQFMLIFILSFAAYHLTRYGTDLFSNKVNEVWFSVSTGGSR